MCAVPGHFRCGFAQTAQGHTRHGCTKDGRRDWHGRQLDCGATPQSRVL